MYVLIWVFFLVLNLILKIFLNSQKRVFGMTVGNSKGLPAIGVTACGKLGEAWVTWLKFVCKSLFHGDTFAKCLLLFMRKLRINWLKVILVENWWSEVWNWLWKSENLVKSLWKSRQNVDIWGIEELFSCNKKNGCEFFLMNILYFPLELAVLTGIFLHKLNYCELIEVDIEVEFVESEKIQWKSSEKL